MIIGSEFSQKYHQLIQKIGELSEGDTRQIISVHNVNMGLQFDRSEIKSVLEYLQNLGYIDIETIGGPLLYGHISITKVGLRKCNEIN